MPRRPLIRSNELPYHVTARCNNREPFYCDLKDIWEICSINFAEMILRYECKVHAFVLMPNHLHVLISTPKEDLGVIMQTYMILITKKINAHTGRSGRVFGSRYHWSLVDQDHYYDCALKYIYRNPVKAGLISKVQDYPFSTLQQVIKNEFDHFKLEPILGHKDLIPDGKAVPFIHWLNQPFPNEEYTAIQKGFKKTRFFPSLKGWKQRAAPIQGFHSENF